ncbi:virion structural protein [Pseudomonas phage Littlefix]|uniref:Uncharacterized protein n=1 Tax=Pseudomonas phage Littlefix TaxID=2079289 RepID=A0A2K9VHQ6_9CAUD|nr:virion structural protein [Pseudomonas phage Littlefix]AUV61839.1 hypothetical protein PsPhLittlefix_gp24 [Pseudomonas phage Littlefix]
MKLSDILTTLQAGELNNLSLFDELGKLKVEHQAKLRTSINLALTDLHTRFLLKKGKIKINLIPGQVTYPILPMFQEGNPAPPGTVQFIDAEGTRVKQNLLKITEVTDYHGRQLSLNGHDGRFSVYTQSTHVLGVPEAHWNDRGVRELFVTYRMNADLLQSCNNWETDFETIYVELDYVYMHALCLFVASRLHNPQGFGPETVHEGNNYWGKYLAECQRLEADGTDIDDVADNWKRRQKGFP